MMGKETQSVANVLMFPDEELEEKVTSGFIGEEAFSP